MMRATEAGTRTRSGTRRDERVFPCIIAGGRKEVIKKYSFERKILGFGFSGESLRKVSRGGKIWQWMIKGREKSKEEEEEGDDYVRAILRVSRVSGG